MSSLEHFRLMAPYNAWMNTKVYDAAATLGPEEVARDCGAFFGSIIGTLNHLVDADLIWLGRLALHPPFAGRIDLDGLPKPDSVTFVAADDLPQLRQIRDRLDQIIIAFIDTLTDEEIAVPFAYRRTTGAAHKKPLSAVLSHVFNHQTHHRGQVTTLLTQAGVDVGVTDLLVRIPELD